MRLLPLIEFALKPHVATIVFGVFVLTVLGFVIFYGESNSFIQFGPSEDTRYAGMVLNTWPKVLFIYAVSFFTTVLQGYYQIAMDTNFNSHILSSDKTRIIPFGMGEIFGLSGGEKVIEYSLTTLDILSVMTAQLQFMLPSLVGDLAVSAFESSYLISSRPRKY